MLGVQPSKKKMQRQKIRGGCALGEEGMRVGRGGGRGQCEEVDLRQEEVRELKGNRRK